MTEIDYRSVEIPENESPEDYHYTARRAEVLKMVEEAGHPRVLNQSRLADRYDCSPANINNDLDVLGDYVEESLGKRRYLTASAVFDKCIQELLEDGEWRKAAQTLKDREEWVTERKELQELADRLERIEEAQQQSAGVVDLEDMR